MKEKINEYLKKYLGSNAEFRHGQIEAIELVLKNEKVLLVQKTGWGKSLVYFLSLKVLKEMKGSGLAIIITPLLALIRDQIQKANEFEIRAGKLTSDQDKNEIEQMKKLIFDKQIDLLFVSPERFSNSEFMDNIFPHLDVILFVIDEAHCISDWGHDFRPDYMRLVNIFSALPNNTPLILTTATANNRVVNDIQSQFGNNLKIVRGPLTRESLRIQTIELPEQATRLAWLKENIIKLNGSGIIYTSTIRDSEKVANWLKENGINVLSYHGQLNTEERIDREQLLINNEVKALVATVALGMGFDKGDLSFIVHFQSPGSLVSYYQEIGRAGRNIDDAIIVLLAGEEDESIQLSFIDNKLSENDLKKVWDCILDSNGIKQTELLKKLNVTQKLLAGVLKILEVRNLIYQDSSKLYHVTPKKFVLNLEKDKVFREVQIQELDDLQSFIKTKDCYMKYIARKLSDDTAKDCGRCRNCTNKNIVDVDVSQQSIDLAIDFLNSRSLIIVPRKQLPYGFKFEITGKHRLPDGLINEEGRVLAIYGDTGYGKRVKKEKYVDRYFSDEMVEISASYISNKWEAAYREVKWVTCIPSYKNLELVENFAKRLAKALNLPFKLAIIKTKSTRPEQKTMQNSQNQYQNAYTSFDVDGNAVLSSPVLLVDDIVDSRMSFFVCGIKLKLNGSGKVYPFALASSSKGGNFDE